MRCHGFGLTDNENPDEPCIAGTRSVAMIFRAVVFTFIPTAIELALVSWLLAKSFSPSVAALVIATFVAYVGWTTLMTKVPWNIKHCIWSVMLLRLAVQHRIRLWSLCSGQEQCLLPWAMLCANVLSSHFDSVACLNTA